MAKANSKRTNFRKMINSFAGRSILVVGDVMLDEYVWGKATRISPEAPVPVVEIENRTFNAGGAANTVNNILAMGGGAYLMGLVGRDDNGRLLKSILDNAGIRTDLLLSDPARPTTSKVRIIAHGQQVMRADHETVAPISKALADKSLKMIARMIDKFDGIAVSDYSKGVVSPHFMSGLITLAKENGKPITADIKPSNAALFRGITLVKPNRSEASKMTGVQITDDKSLEIAARALMSDLAVEIVLITLGEDGMALFRRGEKVRRFPAVATQVYDVTGAGDTVLAAVTLGLSAGFDPGAAAELANLAAGVVVRKRGTTTATAGEIRALMESLHK